MAPSAVTSASRSAVVVNSALTTRAGSSPLRAINASSSRTVEARMSAAVFVPSDLEPEKLAAAAVFGRHTQADAKRGEIGLAHQVGAAARPEQHLHAPAGLAARRQLVDRRDARAAGDQQRALARGRRLEWAAQRAHESQALAGERLGEQPRAAADAPIQDLDLRAGGRRPGAKDRHRPRQQRIRALGPGPDRAIE